MGSIGEESRRMEVERGPNDEATRSGRVLTRIKEERWVWNVL